MNELSRIFGRLKDRFFPKRYPEYDDYELSPVDYGAAPDKMRRLKIAGFLILITSVPFWIYVAMLRDSEMERRRIEGTRQYEGFEMPQNQTAQAGGVGELQDWVTDVEKAARLTGGDSRALRAMENAGVWSAGQARTPTAAKQQAGAVSLDVVQPYAIDRASARDPFADADLRKAEEAKMKEKQEAEKAAAEDKAFRDREEEERRLARAEYSSKISYSISEPSADRPQTASAAPPPSSGSQADTPAGRYSPRALNPIEIQPRDISPY